MAATPTLLPNGKAPNPLYNGQRIRSVVDLMPQGLSDRELALAYRGLTWDLEDERLILEATTLDDVDEFYNPGTEDVGDQFILEAVTIDHFSRTEKRMSAVVRVLNQKLSGSEIQALAPVVGRPKKSGGFAYVTVQLPFSDGQSVSVVFHSPEGDKKIGPDDQIIAFRWLLNKRDITHVVAPEDGAEVSLDSIAIRVTQLVQKNSAKFSRQQKEAFGEVQALQGARDALAAANEQKQALADRVLAVQEEYKTLAAKVQNTQRAIEKQQNINAALEGKIADAKAKQVANPGVKVTNSGDASGDFDPTTPEGYGKVMADESLQLKYQDQLDSFLQQRIVDVRNALRGFGWSADDNGILSKEGHTLLQKYKQIGAGANVVGVSWEISDVPGFFMSNNLGKSPEDTAKGIDLGLVSYLSQNAKEDDTTATTPAVVPVLPSKDQMSNPGKRASKILYAHGWELKAMEPGFHAVLGNPPYQDLSIETQSDEDGMVRILFTQFTEMGGDLVIDSEIVFRVSPTYGMLKQIQTAGRGPGGEFRGNGSVFGNVITKNYIGAGFDKPGKVTVKDSVDAGDGGNVEPEQPTSPADMFILGTEVEVNFGPDDTPDWKRGKYMGGHKVNESEEWHYVDFSDMGLDPLTSVMGSSIRKAKEPQRGDDSDNLTRPDPDNTASGTPLVDSPPDPTPEPAVEPTPQPEPTPAAEPQAVGVLNAIVAGDYDNNPQGLEEALDGAAAELEAAGLMDQYDALLNQAADKAAAVAIEAARTVA